MEGGHSRAADQLRRSVGRPHQHKEKASERAPRLGHNHFATGRRQNAKEPWLAADWTRQRGVGDGCAAVWPVSGGRPMPKNPHKL